MPAPVALRPEPKTPVSTRPVAPAPEPAAGASDFINLGDWLREEEQPRSTRMVVEERAPTGDEEADFAAMLRKFKQGVAENVEDTDYDSHYDLGVAYKEMGLTEEAIAEFQRALRGTERRARTYEALGQCFLDLGQANVATSLLQRATQEPGMDDQQLVGVLYLLGRAAEMLNHGSDAVRYYERVLAVDITFSDVAERIGALEQVTR
jgi:tetratricopeptide (TPR) repeat protein